MKEVRSGDERSMKAMNPAPQRAHLPFRCAGRFHPDLAAGGGAGPACCRRAGSSTSPTGRRGSWRKKCWAWSRWTWKPAGITCSPSPRAAAAAGAHLLAGAQWVFSFVAAEGSTWTQNVARLAPEARLVSLSQCAAGRFAGHLTDYLVEQLQPWPAWQQGVVADPRLHRPARHRPAADRPRSPSTTARPDRSIVIHPGSGSPHKCWPPGSFLELTRRLAAARGRAARHPR